MQRTRNDDIKADEWIDGEKSLFVVKRIVDRCPVGSRFFGHQERCHRPAADRDTHIGLETAPYGICIGQQTSPTVFEITAVPVLLKRRYISFSSEAEMSSQMDAKGAADTERRALDRDGTVGHRAV